MIGRTLDHYRIESKLGEGGMGVVYKARDTHLDRPVAIKVLPHDKVADPTRKQRFVQEAKAASALNHPNIVTIHDIRSEAGVDFIVMEFIEGSAERAGLRGVGEGRQHELRLVPPPGGPELKLTDIRPRGFLRAVTVAWCPDSSCVVVTDSVGEAKPDALFVVSLESGEKRQLTTSQDTVFADSNPAISPDGKWLVFRREVAPFAGELNLLPLRNDLTAAGEPRPLTPITLYAYNPRWMPDSTEIVFSAKAALWRHSASQARGRRSACRLWVKTV